MRLLIIRHGEPDYEHDSLTENGVKEAQALSDCLLKERIDDCYQSPLGRARKTASYYLAASGKTAETLDWLREFPARVQYKSDPELFRAMPTPWAAEPPDDRCVWDILPSHWCRHEEYYDDKAWRDSPIARRSDMEAVYDAVCRGLDALLERYGYVRDGRLYRVTRSDHRTAALFCHFGVGCVLISHLLGISPFVLQQGLMALPTSVTEIVTEEREKGIAAFRMLRYGDLSHLASAGIKPSFAGRYCECFEDKTRH